MLLYPTTQHLKPLNHPDVILHMLTNGIVFDNKVVLWDDVSGLAGAGAWAYGASFWFFIWLMVELSTEHSVNQWVVSIIESGIMNFRVIHLCMYSLLPNSLSFPILKILYAFYYHNKNTKITTFLFICPIIEVKFFLGFSFESSEVFLWERNGDKNIF